MQMSGMGISDHKTKSINLINKYIRNNDSVEKYLTSGNSIETFARDMSHIWPEFAKLIRQWIEEAVDIMYRRFYGG